MFIKRIHIRRSKNESCAKKISFLVFIWSSVLFSIGLQYDLLDVLDILLFWLPILIIIFVIIFQIFFLTDNRFVLFEIFIFYILLHLIYTMGYYGLRGSDSYIDYNIVKIILNNNHFNLGHSASGYPMIHIFSSITSLIGKIDAFQVAKFIPSLFSSLIVLPIYLLSYYVYNNRRIALFSSLIYGTIPQFVSFEAVFVREVLGLFAMALFFCLVYISDKKLNYRLYLLIFVLIPFAIFSHHLTSILLLSLLIIYLIVSKILPYIFIIIQFFYRKGKYIIRELSSKVNMKILIIILVFSISLFSYWAFLYGLDFAWGLIYDVVSDISGTRNAGGTYSEAMGFWSPIVTLKGNIIFYGFFLFNFIFSLLMIFKFFKKDIKQKIEDSTFMLFYFLCMFLGFLTMFVISFLAFPERFLPYGFMFALIPLSGFIIILKKDSHKKIIVALLVFFMIFNLYSIDTQNYTQNATFTGGAVSEKEYLIAKQINFPDEYYGYIAAVAAIYDIQGVPQRDGGKGLGSINNFNNSSTMAVINEAIYVHDLEHLQQKSLFDYLRLIKLLSYQDDKHIDKICDFGNIYVIKGGE